MFNPLSNQDLARLHAKFVVPIVVDHMLHDEEQLDEVAEHAMNEILFDLCPDTALLCIAMCARHVARATDHLLISKSLEAQATQIIEEYGPLWLMHEANPASMDGESIRELLCFIPEDLEALRDLLEATMSELEEDHCVAAILCDILSLQADHHRDMAELELDHLNIPAQSRELVEQAKSYGDNVVAFPVIQRGARQLRP
ncbi:MAG: hypothetical protein H6867_02460 [Rhodospirillales bacterium]|nr:hypothetical protein [Rhodospirillales bacterium]MCB9997052.1 hypothetical protein [Rhodospirillales bacterium]